jgi:hypothetical protein
MKGDLAKGVKHFLGTALSTAPFRDLFRGAMMKKLMRSIVPYDEKRQRDTFDLNVWRQPRPSAAQVR